MALNQAIRAGEAFLELTVQDNKFATGLSTAMGRVRGVAGKLTTIGAGISAVGAAITAPLLVSIHTFTHFGEELYLMSQRTGASVEKLSLLGYAAEQTGSSLGAVEQSIGLMQRSLSGLNKTTVRTQAAFGKLGLNLASIRNLDAGEQFTAILDAMGKITDKAKRTGIAMTLLGRGGRRLLPLVEEWRALSAEAQHFNLIVSTATAKRAHDLDSAFTLLEKVFKKLRIAVGDAFSEALTKTLHAIAEIAKEAIAWAEANKGLILTIGIVGAVIGAVGSAVTAFGLTITVLSVAFSGIIGLLSLFLTPWPYIIAGVVGATYAFLKFTDAGKQVVSVLKVRFLELKRTLSETVEGISDALSGGDVKLAAEVLWSGLALAWAEGTQDIVKIQHQWQKVIAEDIINFGATIQEVWTNIWSFMETTLSNTLSRMEKTWVASQAIFSKTWHDLIAGLDEIKAGVDVARDTRLKGELERAKTNLQQEKERIARGGPDTTLGNPAEDLRVAEEAVARTKAAYEAQRQNAEEARTVLRRGERDQTAFDDALESKRKEKLAKIQQDQSGTSTQIETERQGKQKKIADDLAGRQAAINKQFADKDKEQQDDLAKKRAAFDAARQKARDLRIKTEKEREDRGGGAADIASGGSGLVRSTFSSRLAPQIFGAAGNDVQAKQLGKLTKIEANTKVLDKIANSVFGVKVGDK